MEQIKNKSKQSCGKYSLVIFLRKKKFTKNMAIGYSPVVVEEKDTEIY